jgi:hypothetical protein
MIRLARIAAANLLVAFAQAVTTLARVVLPAELRNDRARLRRLSGD